MAGSVLGWQTIVVTPPAAAAKTGAAAAELARTFDALLDRGLSVERPVAILSGDLPRGTKLRQASLAEELGVSRTPLSDDKFREHMRESVKEFLEE